MVPIAVLLSGRGSNFQALQEAIRDGRLPARIAVVASDRADAAGLELARGFGLPAVVAERRSGETREQHEARLREAIAPYAPQWICLAGYMRILSPAFIAAFPQRIVNIHPSLLPAFPGLDAQAQAWAHGVRVAGCTVHLVDASLDGGPIVAQTAVDVASAGDAAELAQCILAVEHRTYAEALRDLFTRPWRIEGRRLAFSRVGETAGVDSRSGPA
jgi:phosphoribosylglycinamide formyltransferase-1